MFDSTFWATYSELFLFIFTFFSQILLHSVDDHALNIRLNPCPQDPSGDVLTNEVPEFPYGAFINDVMQIWTIVNPLPCSVTHLCPDVKNALPPPPLCMTSFMNDPFNVWF